MTSNYMNGKKPDPNLLAKILTNEVDRTSKQAAKALMGDVSAGAETPSDNSMLTMVRANWDNPQFRADLMETQSPERIVDWYLRAFNIPMTLSQYQKTLESDPTMIPGYDNSPNTGAPPLPKVDQPQQLQPPAQPAPPAQMAAPVQPLMGGMS